MARKPRRRPVYFSTFSYPGGVAWNCMPIRKPHPTEMKSMGYQIDDDLVVREHLESPDDLMKCPSDSRAMICGVLANRLNSRRAIRDLVLPELAKIESMLGEIRKRLDRLENHD